MEPRTSWRRALVDREGGFTIVEVLTVVILIGILTAIATATWSGLIESRKATSATNQLVADLRFAHSSASNQLTRWHVAYKLDGSPFSCGGIPDADYCLLKISGSTVTQTTPRRLPDGTRILETNVGSTPPLNLLNYNRALEFKPDGTAKPLGPMGLPITLALGAPWLTVGTDDGSNCHELQINEITSRVQVDPPGLNEC